MLTPFCIAQHGANTDYNQCKEYYAAIGSALLGHVIAGLQLTAWAIHEYREEIIAAFTVILAVATWRLWLATRDLVDGAKDTAKRQLRAYLSISPAGFRDFDPSKKLIFLFKQINTGNTPAYEASQSGVILFLSHPLPDKFPFPKVPDKRLSKTGLAPRLEFQGTVKAEKDFTQAELIEALQGPAQDGKRLYFFGEVNYMDAFGDKHWQRYCFSFPGWHEAIPLAQNGNWDAINKVLVNPGLALSFEAANQHNITDQG